jgi:hypothetical protein
MVYVREGDAEPKVCAIQLLLNTHGVGEPLKVDGHFGRNTRKAVVQFQRKHRLRPDGAVGKTTWEKLNEGSGFGVVDALDFSDAVMPRDHGPFNGQIADSSTAALQYLTAAGADPIVTGAMSSGGGRGFSDIVQRPAALWQWLSASSRAF